MNTSRFAFVEDSVTRTHLDRAFELIVELVTLSEARSYTNELKSSFRKTIIIYTASIIEAELLLALRSATNETDCGECREVIGETLYEISDMKRIVLVEMKFSPIKFSKLNLDQINKLCKSKNLINAELSKRIDVVRDLRNRQHLGSLSEIEVMYTKQDLELIFSVAKETINRVERILHRK